jgi:hypothetical protein
VLSTQPIDIGTEARLLNWLALRERAVLKVFGEQTLGCIDIGRGVDPAAEVLERPRGHRALRPIDAATSTGHLETFLNCCCKLAPTGTLTRSVESNSKNA